MQNTFYSINQQPAQQIIPENTTQTPFPIKLKKSPKSSFSNSNLTNNQATLLYNQQHNPFSKNLPQPNQTNLMMQPNKEYFETSEIEDIENAECLEPIKYCDTS